MNATTNRVENEGGGALAAAAGSLQDVQVRVQETLSTYDKQVREFVREHPVATVLGAAAVGYLLGRLLSKL